MMSLNREGSRQIVPEILSMVSMLPRLTTGPRH